VLQTGVRLFFKRVLCDFAYFTVFDTPFLQMRICCCKVYYTLYWNNKLYSHLFRQIIYASYEKKCHMKVVALKDEFYFILHTEFHRGCF
jgi:hypothetical protein